MFFEIIKIALSAIKANKLRSFLTILGIIVGIFSIIATSTVLSMLQNGIEEGVSQLGQNTFQIQKFPAVQMGPGSREKYRNRQNLKLNEYYKLKEQLTEAKYVGAEVWTYGKIIKFNGNETNPNNQVAGVTLEAFPNNKWQVAMGRTINDNDVNHYYRVCVLGKDIVTKIFGSINPLGLYVNVDKGKFKVIGVLEAQGEMFGQSRDNIMIVPITTYQQLFASEENSSINITVMTQKDNYDKVMEQAIGYFRNIRKVQPGEENDFDIFSNESVLTQINSITKYVKIGALVISFISLLAAGVGIMNIMLVSVTERTKEIGIRKSIGAQKNNILLQFIFEAIVLCIVGGIFGIFFGILVGIMVGSQLGVAAVVPWDSIILGISVCIIVGLVFGTYPAYKAANLDPIEALRWE